MKKYSVKNLNESFHTRKVVAYIPVRGGSKGIKGKNIRLFCGKPLVYWVVKSAMECSLIDEIIVSSDDLTIRTTVEEFGFEGVKVVSRSSETATDEASTESAMLEFAANYEFDDIVLIQATSPLLESEDLNSAISAYFANNVDSIVSVVRQKRFIWEETEEGARSINYNPSNRPRRQDFAGHFVENGAFYITSKESLLLSQCRISGKISLYEMQDDNYFEIDEERDWIIAEELKKRRLREQTKYRNLNHINLLISDVDGVLTDAGMYYSNNGEELKKFNTRDGKGIELIKEHGIKVMLLTSEDVNLVRNRANKLKVDYLFMGVRNKKEFLDKFFAENLEFNYSSTAYIGDDINDLECIDAVDISAVPSDAHETMIKSAKYVCKQKGGSGCVREFCELIINRRTT